jgi:DNA-directed RNA polymerase specialized sigma24 family protein
MLSTSSKYETEQTLVACMRSGSNDAFSTLYCTYSPLLLGYLLKVVTDKKTAENILQQAFIEIWNNKDQYNGLESLYIWMLQVTKKAALPYIVFDNTLVGKIQSPLSFVNIDDISIEQKNELYKKTLELVHYNKYSLNEASTVLNISADGLKTILRDAVKNLKTMQK